MSPILTGVIASGISGNLTPAWSPEGAYDALASVTLSTSASSISFSGIPSGYKHLQVRLNVRGTRSFPTEQLYIRLNNDSASGSYRYHYIYGDGSGVSAGASGADTVILVNEFPGANENANVYSTSIIDVLDYNNTSKLKTLRSLSSFDNNGNTGNAAGKIWLGSGLWINTNSVTSLTILSNGPFATNSQFAIYGVK